MLVRTKRSWELPECIASPEALVMNRRGLFKVAGVVAATGALAGCDRGTVAQNPADAAKTAAASHAPV